MSVTDFFLPAMIVVCTLFFIRLTWQGLRTGALDILVKGARVPVYVYRDKTPFNYWLHIAFNIAVILAMPGLLLYLYVF